MAGKFTVKFYGLMRTRVGTTQVEIPGDDLSVLELLRLTEEKAGRPFLDELLEGGGELLAGAIILVDGENIRLRQGLETRVPSGACLDLFSPAGGG